MQSKHFLSVDIETYSSVDIAKAGLHAYACSPDFRVLTIAAAVDNGPVRVIDLERIDESPARRAIYDDFCAWLTGGQATLHAFNAAFEWYCLGKAGLPTPIERWRCTMAHGLYLGYSGGLDAMGKAVGLPEDKRKLSAGKALIRRFCKPDKDGRRVTRAREPEKWALFEEYNRMDVEAERELERRFAPWPLPEREQRLWEQDARMNAAGVKVDLELVEAARAVWEDEKAELLSEAALISGLDNPNSLAQLKLWLAGELGEGAPETLRKDDVTALIGSEQTPACARRMLEIRQRLGKTSVSKYDALYERARDNGRARGLLQFYGAHTGRWAGRGIQVHNLPKATLHDEELDYARKLLKSGVKAPRAARQALNLCFGSLPDTLSQLVRTALIADGDGAFVVADYSAIEARVVAWLAGEEWVNEVFATHGRIYEATASQMFGVPLERIRKGNPEYALRAKGKVATLALGYGGGTSALIAMGALRMGLAEEELPDIVSRWRNANSRICALWHSLERAAVETVRTGAPRQVRGLTLRWEAAIDEGYEALAAQRAERASYLTIELPTGRKLFYPRPKLEENKFGKEAVFFQAQGAGGWRYQSTWGGTLTENVVQAIARDCLAELLLSIEGEGVGATRFHVHDEVIVEAPARDAQRRLETLLALMERPIPWAPGLKLKGAGFVSPYYKKD